VILLRKLRDRLRKHLPEDVLLLWMSDELPAGKKQDSEQHLAACTKCRAQRDRLKDALSQAVAYRDACILFDCPRPNEQRHRLMNELDKLARLEPTHGEIPRRASLSWSLPRMSPILATSMVCALVSVVCVFIWLQQAKPGITSNALMVRAEAWDLAADNGNASGIIRQTVKIASPKRTVERTILRDVRGKRHPKAQQLTNDEAQFKEKLTAAGVAWDAPLSAMSYQDWHDRQRIRQDQIRRSSGDLLVLTTTVPSGEVAEQSLTVRDTDFHPVLRTVEFRNRETIEIAELDYHVLPWTASEANLFLPMDASEGDYASRRPSLAVLPPVPFTEGQLDEAELGVRLVLNKLHADTGEQIQIERSASGVEVKGLVETERRKQELVGQLHIIPRVKISILSMEELRRRPENGTETTSISVASDTAQPSPLEAYFVNRGNNAESLRSLSHNLLENALTAAQESRAIAELHRRFPSTGEMGPLSQGTLSMLLFSHRRKLTQALDEEQLILDRLVSSMKDTQSESGQNRKTSMKSVNLAERNLALCEELALGSSMRTRKAEEIVGDLAATFPELRRDLQQRQIESLSAGISGEKKK
jgi:hypothetical protein